MRRSPRSRRRSSSFLRPSRRPARLLARSSRGRKNARTQTEDPEPATPAQGIQRGGVCDAVPGARDNRPLHDRHRTGDRLPLSTGVVHRRWEVHRRLHAGRADGGTRGDTAGLRDDSVLCRPGGLGRPLRALHRQRLHRPVGGPDRPEASLHRRPDPVPGGRARPVLRAESVAALRDATHPGHRYRYRLRRRPHLPVGDAAEAVARPVAGQPGRDLADRLPRLRHRRILHARHGSGCLEMDPGHQRGADGPRHAAAFGCARIAALAGATRSRRRGRRDREEVHQPRGRYP